MNSSRIELLWLAWDQSRSKYYLRTKFQDGIDKPQKCQNVCYHPTHQQQSDFLILVLYDFIVQSILSSLLLLCYNLMIMKSKVVRLLFAQRFITIFNCCYHTSNHLSVCHKPTSLSPINCQSVDNCCIISWESPALEPYLPHGLGLMRGRH
jgi:hypothetical protein